MTPSRAVRIVLGRVADQYLSVRAEIDGELLGPEQSSRLAADFHFTYQDFVRARRAECSPARIDPGQPTATVTVDPELAALHRLGDAIGRAVFPGPLDGALEDALAEARTRNETMVLIFEAADSTLLSIPFEAARLASGTTPALEAGVRILRQHSGFALSSPPPLPGPLRILVAVGAPDEGKTDNVALDVEAELQTILDAVDQAPTGGRPGLAAERRSRPLPFRVMGELNDLNPISARSTGSVKWTSNFL